MSMSPESVLERLHAVACDFAETRSERQQRRHLDPADFARLREAGYPLLAIPQEHGGMWQGTQRTVRTACEALRMLAHGDSSVALVAAMHPAVLSYWFAAPDEARATREFATQCEQICRGVREGTWWGTITSEPGSGGDVAKTRAVAQPTGQPQAYELSGDKHFGSGSGVLDVMVTTAVAAGEDAPDWFFVRTKDIPGDGAGGLTLLAEWDGQGMTATQSHSQRFARFPATRIAWPGHLSEIAARSGPFIGCLFTSVIVGIVEVAVETARGKLGDARQQAFAAVEWERVQIDAWLIRQAYEGMLRSIETAADPRREVLQGKTAIAELAETCLTRLCRLLGGGTYHRRSPFGHWFEDVRALGYLRPPWGLAFETLMTLPPT